MTTEHPIDLSSMSMLDLFRLEAANLTDGMTTALIDLEAHPADVAYLADLMRSAHSLKGAARIVGVDPLVALGHAMEDRLCLAQRQSGPMSRQHVDALLEGTDVFARIVGIDDAALPGWLDGIEPTLSALVERLSAKFPAADARSNPPDACAPASTPSRTSEPPAGLIEKVPPAPDTTRNLRLEASQLESLLGLARESLLVNRAHQRQATQLQRLRVAQRHVAASLERLHEAVRTRAGTDQIAALVNATIEASRRCDATLDAHILDHATQTRRGHRISTRLHHTINSTRMTRFSSIAAVLKRLARDTGQRLHKPVTLTLQGADTQLDRDVLERIEAPLIHMVRNAIDHGIETADERRTAGKQGAGQIVVAARHHRGQLEVAVTDDGRGVELDALRQRLGDQGLSSPDMLARMSESELLQFLFLPRFSTRDEVSETSGRGIGLDVVQTCVQELGGRLRTDNRPGQGLSITLVLPVSLSLVRALLLRVDGETYALALSQLERVVRVQADASSWVAGQPCITVGGRDIAWAPLGPILGAARPPTSPMLTLVEIATPTGRFALAVDELLGERDLALQALDPRLPKPIYISAAAVLDDGSPVLLLDVADLASSLTERGAGSAIISQPPPLQQDTPGNSVGAAQTPSLKRILVVEDSFTVREVERKVLTAGGYSVDVAVDGVEGWNALCTRPYDLVVTDIDMPRMNGLELLRRIRANDSTRTLPVMIVSYKDREEDRMAGLQAGADRYFVKSGFEEAALLEAASDLIG